LYAFPSQDIYRKREKEKKARKIKRKKGRKEEKLKEKRNRKAWQLYAFKWL
jgi:hypothetical protein